MHGRWGQNTRRGLQAIMKGFRTSLRENVVSIWGKMGWVCSGAVIIMATDRLLLLEASDDSTLYSSLVYILPYTQLSSWKRACE